ncbi:CHSTB-like protein [Mya arenaria]|uniref:Carbohydrate sulfotransferase n=1 Tax=Mya arenaria TaxID=6604 RepID=A0ABY7G6V2_MYAAR|nr:uncharacterized protein LOC128221923 [Mya arenaria]WAR30157.1 CHSTB-like protein [Mya arenaria]
MSKYLRKSNIIVWLAFSVTGIIIFIHKSHNAETLKAEAFVQVGNTRAVAKTSQTRKRFHDLNSTIKSTCQRSELFENYTTSKCGSPDNILHVETKGLAYCFIQKISSTFWKRILQIAGNGIVSNVTNPNYISPLQAQKQRGYKRLTGRSWKEVGNLFRNITTFMFVRNPYHRLFSAWFDKLYSPNVHFWKTIGQKAGQTGNEDSCAKSVSFPELVEYVTENILSKQCLDGHFSTYHQHCRPCDIEYTYVGKYEHLKEDTQFIIDAVNLTAEVEFGDFANDATMDAIIAASSWVYQERKRIESCGVSFSCALFRTWHWLAGRGVISKQVQFPYSVGNNTASNHSTKEEFIARLKEASQERKLNEKEHNRNEAFAQAMSTLTKDHINRIKQAYELDFEIFGYELTPPEFQKHRNTLFDYFPYC